MDLLNNLKAMVILHLNGKRAIAKYYDESLNTGKFEKQLYAKIKNPKSRDEVFVIGDVMVVHRYVAELHIFVVGSRRDNPMTLDRVLNCLVETTSTLLSKGAENKPINNFLSQYILAFDEICDQSIILETDPNLILDRVCLKENVVEQSLASVLQSASDQMRFPWIYR